MKILCQLLSLLFFLVISTIALGAESDLFAKKFLNVHGTLLSSSQKEKVYYLLTNLRYITRNIGTEDLSRSTGPNHSAHPVSRQQCIEKVLDTKLIVQNTKFESHCGAKWMAPVFEFEGQKIEQTKLCIDQFEFPNIPCEYPVVWVSSSQAKQLCESMGKRLCDSHEWEGACAGSIKEDYAYKDEQRLNQGELNYNKSTHNRSREITFAYDWDGRHKGEQDTRNLCGVYSNSDPEITADHSKYSGIGKSTQCHKGSSDYLSCGTNTWPAGFKNLCRTKSGVYDLHGNVAEVVNFPRGPRDQGRVGGSDKTERKGSFFVYRSQYPNDCRVRQPFEHFNTIVNDGHSYYQEGFRCCRDVN